MIDIKCFLENSVYYPACGYDGTPIKYLGKLYSNFVYVDYEIDYFNLEKEISIEGLLGYKLKNIHFFDLNEIFGIEWWEYIDKLKKTFVSGRDCTIYDMSFSRYKLSSKPFANLFSFERSKYYSEFHGKKKIELLYIKAEGISAYNELYVKNNIVPKCLVSICPGFSSFSGYHKTFVDLIKSSKNFSEYHLYDNQCARDFPELLKYYTEVNQYKCGRRKEIFYFSKLKTLM